MDSRGENRARVLCVGIDLDSDTTELVSFDRRQVETVDDARTILERRDEPADAWYPHCVVSAERLDTEGDGLELLRWVETHTSDVATVLAPRAGSERLASRALAAGVTAYALADDSLGDAVREALERGRLVWEGPQRTDRWYRTLAENLPNGAVALYDRDLRYLVVDGTVFDELPLDRDRLEGNRVEAVHSVSYIESYGRHYRAALDGDHAEFEFTYDDRVFRAHTVPVRNREGWIVAGMALTQDVTDERAQRRQLERQNQRLDRFASVVSHDLRNPLNVVDGSVVLLQDAARAGDLDAVDENTERISRACRRMNDIVDNVLELARQPGTVENPGVVPLRETATRVWADIDADHATLSVDLCGPGEIGVRADGAALARLLENLLVNAVEHGSNGRDGVSVRVEWFEGVGDEGGERGDGGFAVSDDGEGLSREAYDHVFDWGYTTEDSGVGLGLSIVAEVVDAHDWDLAVTESAAGGARFEVRGVDCVAVDDLDRAHKRELPGDE